MEEKITNKQNSKYYNTACLIDEAFLRILENKDFEYITVKEICAKAGVNRSTFYLHYETTADLLEESMAFLNDKFREYFNFRDKDFIKNISTAPLSELNLITPEYLSPYLDFIKEHKRIYVAAVKNSKLFRLDKTYERMFEIIFNPILDRFNVEERQKRFITCYYIHGIMAIVGEWLKGDCKEPTSEIIEIIQKCVVER